MDTFVIIVLFVIVVLCSVVAEYYIYYKPNEELKNHIKFFIAEQQALYDDIKSENDLLAKEILELHHRFPKIEQGSNNVENLS